jgi:hypothetical protein
LAVRRTSLLVPVVLAWGRFAFASEASARPPAASEPAPDTRVAEPPDTPLRVGSTYHLFGGLAYGRALRFNNPYRLETELGSSAESVSLAAPYVDVRLGATFGGAGVVSHGVVVHGSFALSGVPQEVVSPSYVVLVRPSPRFGISGRAGIPIVVEPDANAGFEAAVGGIAYVTAGVGVTCDLVGSLFFGAATLDTPRTAIPLLALELGVLYDYEVLP